MPAKDLSSLRESGGGLYVGNMLQDFPLCGVVAVDAQTNIVLATPEAEEMLRTLRGGAAAEPTAGLPAPVLELIREMRETGQLLVERELTLPMAGLPPTVYAVTVAPGTGAQPGAAVVVLRSLSARGRLEQTLLRLDRLASLGTLSATMTHEMKNALVAIKTFVDLLLEKHQDAELAGVVSRELKRLDAMVLQMLKYAAPPLPTLSPVRLHEILDHSLRLVQHRAGGPAINFKREFRAQPDVFLGDAHQLEQAFLNLLLNALEAMLTTGTLTVRTELLPAAPPATAQFRVQISDTGPGIPTDSLGSIFDLFYTTKNNGTGLGLPVTRCIIQDHGGSISAESQPGLGATFTILLPVRA